MFCKRRAWRKRPCTFFWFFFLPYSPGYDVFQGGSRYVPAIFPHTCTGRRLLSFIIPEEGRRLLHGKGGESVVSLQGRLRGWLFLQNPPCSRHLFCPQNKEGMPRLPGRGEGIFFVIFHGEGGAEGRASAPQPASRRREGTPCARGVAKFRWSRHGPAGKIPASAKRPR